MTQIMESLDTENSYGTFIYENKENICLLLWRLSFNPDTIYIISIYPKIVIVAQLTHS